MNSYKKLIEHFAKRAQEYDQLGTWVKNSDILQIMCELLPNDCSNYSFIDIGAGTGAVSSYIFEKKPTIKRFVALDVSDDMLSHITNEFITKCCAPVESIPFSSKTFDVAVSRQCLHYVEDLNMACDEIRRVLKDDSIFLLAQITPIAGINEEYWKEIVRFRSSFYKNFISTDEWVDLLENHGFNCESITHVTHRGSVKKWEKKYGVASRNKIMSYRKLLVDAPELFKETYHVEETEDDVLYNVNWSIFKFKCNG